jgi:hypothetical protein
MRLSSLVRIGVAKQLAVAALGVLLMSLGSCGGAGGETELLPPSRDGIFYTVFADACQTAATEEKLILLEMWRPG